MFKNFKLIQDCMLLTYHISQGHDVVLGQGKCFYLGQFPRLVHVGDYFSQVLIISNIVVTGSRQNKDGSSQPARWSRKKQSEQ